MASDLPELSKAEWVVMKACWERKKCTAREVFEETQDARDWEYQTVKTMLDRLVKKGYLVVEKFGPLCLFKPKVSRAKALARAIDSFSDTVLDNTFAPLFAHLAKGRKLSDDEIAALRRLIDESGEEQQ